MISFITSAVPDPWSNNDIQNFELYGSQRDDIIYNSVYNSKIRYFKDVTIDLYLVSAKIDSSLYKNFYIFPLTRSKFFFFICISELEIYKDIKDNSIVKNVVNKLPLFKKITNSFSSNGGTDVCKEVKFLGSCIMIEVNASVGEFLFPKYKYITNNEIKKKYAILNSLYIEVLKEWSYLVQSTEKYQELQIKQRKEAIKSILIKTGVRVAAGAAIAYFTGLFLDVDAFWGDKVEIPDLDYDEIASTYNDDSGYSVSFKGHENIDRLYDSDIEQSYDRYYSDIEKVAKGEISLDDAERVLNSDKWHIDYWEQSKSNAIIQADKDQAFLDHINGMNDIIEKYRVLKRY